MRFVCLGYMDETKWGALSQQEQETLMEECFAYDDFLRRNGHFAGGEALQSAATAATLRWRDGQVQGRILNTAQFPEAMLRLSYL